MKTAIVTGGGTGIGQAIAFELAKRDIDVIIIGRRLKPLQETAQKFPERINVIQADITNDDELKKIAEQLQGKTIDFLIHNAGMEGLRDPLNKITRKIWQQVQSLNVEAPVFLTQALLSKLVENTRILLVSSGLAHYAIPNYSAYCASKAALNMVAKSFNVEFEANGIITAILDPGPVDTSMQDRLRDMEKDGAERLFEELQASGSLAKPADVGLYAVTKLTETANKEFLGTEWAYS